MKLEHFRYFLEINRLHSISAAARSLHIRQTTLSAIVKNAEAELGYPVFQRAPTGVILTPPGEQFMALAWEINSKYEDILSLKQRSTDEVPTVRLLLPPALSTCLSVPLTALFYQFELRGELAFAECPSTAVGGRIVENASNLGLAYLTEDNIAQFQPEAEKYGIHIHRLLADQIYLIVSKQHKLAEMDQVDVSLTRFERLAAAKVTRNDPILGKIRTAPVQITVFTDVDLMVQAICDQNMVGFLPGYTTIAGEHSFDRAALSVIPIRNTARANRLFLCLLQKDERSLLYPERILAGCIREHFRKFLDLHPEFSLAGGERNPL